MHAHVRAGSAVQAFQLKGVLFVAPYVFGVVDRLASLETVLQEIVQPARFCSTNGILFATKQHFEDSVAVFLGSYFASPCLHSFVPSSVHCNHLVEGEHVNFGLIPPHLEPWNFPVHSKVSYSSNRAPRASLQWMDAMDGIR